MDQANLPSATNSEGPAPLDLNWVWHEVVKRVFIKVTWSAGLDEALQAAVPITLEGDHFVVGLSSKDWPLCHNLKQIAVQNTIENILRSAAGKPIRFEVIEGTRIQDWEALQQRMKLAQDAVVAMASSSGTQHHVDDILNQIVGEIRQRVSGLQDRAQPQVRARLVLDIAPSLADAEEMLFGELDTRESRRAMGRVIDRIAGFIEVPAITLALEIERHRRQQNAVAKGASPSPNP